MRSRTEERPGRRLSGRTQLPDRPDTFLARRYTGATEPQESQDPQGNTWSEACEQPPPSPSLIVQKAIDAYWQDEHRESTAPHGPFHTPMWAFARYVRSSLPEGVEPNEVFRALVEPEIARRGGWESVLCTDLDSEDLQCDFVYSWERMRYRIGEGPLAVAFGQAQEDPLDLPESDTWRDLETYRLFVTLAFRLQLIKGDEPIFLPRRRIGELLGRSHTQIMRYCAQAVDQGYLELANPHSLVGRKAAEYWFDAWRFPTYQPLAGAGFD